VAAVHVADGPFLRVEFRYSSRHVPFGDLICADLAFKTVPLLSMFPISDFALKPQAPPPSRPSRVLLERPFSSHFAIATWVVSASIGISRMIAAATGWFGGDYYD